MNIQTVADNLRKTIAGKEQMLKRSQEQLVQRPVLDDGAWMMVKTTIQFLEINIAELKRVLQDVEQCIEETV